MIHGLLCKEAEEPHLLLFKCPGCGETHGIFVTSGKHYKTEFTWVWSYRVINQDNLNKKTDLEIHPSLDASKYCGYHGSSTWHVKVMILESNESRHSLTEDWLKSID